MSPQPHRLDLAPRQILVWLVLLVALAANCALALAHLVLGGGTLLVASLWAVRLVALASCWLLPGGRTAKAWGSGLILGSLLLDALLKAPVLGGIEYGDWFLTRSLDLTGSYHGYLVVCGFLFPMLTLAGWFVLRARRAAGWIAGMLCSLLLSLALLLASTAQDATTATFLLLGMARFIIPAWAAALADRLAARRAQRSAANTPGQPTGTAPRKLSTKSARRR